MRLTNTDRDAFIQSVMDDVPKIDYAEKARSLAMKHALKRMPAPVAELYKSNPEWVRSEHIHLGYLPNGTSAHLPVERGFRFDEAFNSQLLQLSADAKEQDKRLRDLRISVRGAIYGCSTLKQAKERLPEFEKYLPAERDGKYTPNLPAVANLVTELMNAGWPKDQKKEEVAA